MRKEEEDEKGILGLLELEVQFKEEGGGGTGDLVGIGGRVSM